MVTMKTVKIYGKIRKPVKIYGKSQPLKCVHKFGYINGYF